MATEAGKTTPARLWIVDILWLFLAAIVGLQAYAWQHTNDLQKWLGHIRLMPKIENFSEFQEGVMWFTIWLLVGIVGARVVHLLWTWVLLPIARRTRTSLDVILLESTHKPVCWVALFAVLNTGAQMCFKNLPQVSSHTLWSVYQGVIYIALVLSVTRLSYATASGFTEWYSKTIASKTATTLDDQFVALFRKVAKFVFLFIALTIIFGHFNIQVTGLLATAGVASLAVAFAAQETLANMISGFILMIDRPFIAGDRVQFSDGQIGDVIDVGLRSTKIMSFDNTVINIPNSEVAKSQIINFNAPNANIKVRCTIGVAYGSDVRKVKKILLEVLKTHPEVAKEPEPVVFFTEFGASSLDLIYAFWVKDYREQLRLRDEINLAINDRFAAEGIEIPFPQHDLHLRTPNLAALRTLMTEPKQKP